MKFSFFLQYADTSTYECPFLKLVEADHMNEAVKAFAAKHDMTVDSSDGDYVWFLLKDGAAVRYLVSERAP